MNATPPGPAPWRAIAAGASASFVGIGLARFAYTPLLPELINAHWFSPSAVAYLGAANLAGYLLGALAARRVARRLGDRRALRWMMVLATVGLLACSVPVSVVWFFAWRLVSGVAGGVIMVRVAGAVLPHLRGERRGLAGGAIFAGLGLGIAASGTLVPLLLTAGLSSTWIGLAALCALLTVLSWNGWFTPRASAAATPSGAAPRGGGSAGSPRLALLLVQYALISMGLVPAMSFLADFVSRGLDRGSGSGAMVWIVYGLGALVGPTLYGLLGDRLGFARALLLIILVQTGALTTLAFVHDLPEVAVLSAVIGSFPPGVVPVVLGRVHELVPARAEEQSAAWGKATVAGALSLAVSAYLYSYVFDLTGQNHRVLFLIGGGALALALLTGLATRFVHSGGDHTVHVTAPERVTTAG
ncbi:YbfB/YjiJ family MFS transporter [Streptomyces sp. MI02-2A]|uniref:YbfB/YjiJ family MFS transporter n=1 Tax=Streptomyces sp. MI02-2A TaxID=3028688 RepID=UPI0029BDD9A6|nr:YbfB/YjiJ family MFS transporter [Streptomyces sp. MI02-2A]MDX3257811.1 YbfB/YjiJ family MFS transporter [Streptomyces sp. MI02-2A]